MNIIPPIVHLASDLSGVSVEDFYRRTRERRIAHQRFGILWALHRHGGLTLHRIKRGLNFGDHTSVFHGIRRAEQMRAENDNFRRYTDKLADAAANLISGGDAA